MGNSEEISKRRMFTSLSMKDIYQKYRELWKLGERL